MKLSIPEELLLLMLDDETGRLHDSAGPGGDLALAGAVLAELSLAGRIDSDPHRLWVADRTPTGDALLDAALARIAAEVAPRHSRHWIGMFGADAEELREALFRRLVEKGVLREEKGRFLWVFPERRYPAVSGREEREVKARILGVLFDDDIPDAHDALLIGLCRAANLFGSILAPAELERAQPRIAQVSELEELNRSLAHAVRTAFAQIARHAPLGDSVPAGRRRGMEMAETSVGGAKVLVLKGRLDTATAHEAEARLAALVEAGGNVAVDLGGVHYVSSAGLRALLKAAKQAKANGAGFALAAPQQAVREVLEISGFDRILGIHPTAEAAAAALA